MANMCNAVVLGAVRWRSPRVVTAHRRYPRSSFLHGVALGLCSNYCTAFRAFRRSLMKSVTLWVWDGNSRNPTYQNHSYPCMHGWVLSLGNKI